MTLEDSLNEFITPDEPIKEVCGYDIVVFSKFDCGRKVVLENFDVDNGEEVLINKLEQLIWDNYDYILSEILDSAIEYCETNDIEINDW